MKGYNQTSFAKRIHISKEYLSNVLNRRYNPSPPTARKIASGIGKKIPDIFFPKVCDKVKQKSSDNKQ